MRDAYGVPVLVGAAIALPILSIITVAMRFYVRLRVRKTFVGIDDYLILAALPLVIGQNIVQILGAEYGSGGRDFKPISPGRKDYQDKLNHGILVFEKFTYTLIKLSVLFFYRRVFKANPKFRIANNALVGLVIVWGLVFLFTDAFACVSESGATTCGAQQWISLWFAITEVVGDLAILSLPYPVLNKLQMGKRDKIGVGMVFALGAISTIIGIIRLGYVAKNFHSYFHHTNNNTGSAPTFWTQAEISIGVVAACLPPLGPLLYTLEPKLVYQIIRRKMSSIGSSGGRTEHDGGKGSRIDSEKVDVTVVHPYGVV